MEGHPLPTIHDVGVCWWLDQGKPRPKTKAQGACLPIFFSDQKLIHDCFNHPSSDGLPQHGGTIPRVVFTPRHLVMVMVSTMNWSCVC